LTQPLQPQLRQLLPPPLLLLLCSGRLGLRSLLPQLQQRPLLLLLLVEGRRSLRQRQQPPTGPVAVLHRVALQHMMSSLIGLAHRHLLLPPLLPLPLRLGVAQVPREPPDPAAAGGPEPEPAAAAAAV
jgi:hypothetical protein